MEAKGSACCNTSRRVLGWASPTLFPNFPPPTSVPQPHLHRDWPATPHGLRKNSPTGAGSQQKLATRTTPRSTLKHHVFLGGCFSAAWRVFGRIARPDIALPLGIPAALFGRYRATTQKEPRQFGAVSTVAQTTAVMIRWLFLGARCPPRRRSSTKPASPPHSPPHSAPRCSPRETHMDTMGKSSLTQTNRLRASSFARPVPARLVVRSRHGASLQRSVSLLDDDSDASAAHHQTVDLERWLGTGVTGGKEGRDCGEVGMISRLSTTPRPRIPSSTLRAARGSRCVCAWCM